MRCAGTGRCGLKGSGFQGATGLAVDGVPRLLQAGNGLAAHAHQVGELFLCGAFELAVRFEAAFELGHGALLLVAFERGR